MASRCVWGEVSRWVWGEVSRGGCESCVIVSRVGVGGGCASCVMVSRVGVGGGCESWVMVARVEVAKGEPGEFVVAGGACELAMVCRRGEGGPARMQEGRGGGGGAVG